VQVTLACNRYNGHRGFTLPPFDTPSVLITRPHDASTRFVAALERAAGSFTPIICPAFDVVGTEAAVPDFEVAVFTSRAGVNFAPAGVNRTAYCVGDATAHAATRAGYKAISSSGSASDLCALILDDAPSGRLLHLRGEVSRRDVMTTLVDGGLNCAQAVVYRKQPMPIDTLTSYELENAETLIIPTFSAETVSIMASWSLCLKGAHVVAISQFVADASTVFSPASITVSDRPDLSSMVALTARLIA